MNKKSVERKYYQDRYEVFFTVTLQEAGLRLDQFIQRYFPSFSREFIKKKILKKEIKTPLRQGVPKASTSLLLHDQVYMICYKDKIEDEYWKGNLISFENEIKILENHNDFCIVNKPPFMCTHPTGRHVFYCATVYASRQLDCEINSVHRLDRETSGVLVLSKNAEGANSISQQFEHHQTRKTYFLIAKKTNKTLHFPFTAKERLGENDDPNLARLIVKAFPEDSQQGKMAETEFELISENNDYLCAFARPKTGRQHQIRVHAAVHGFPLVGDKIYSKDYAQFQRFKDQEMTEIDYEELELPRHALHAFQLEFFYNKEKKCYHAPIANDLIDFCHKKNLSLKNIHILKSTL